MLFKTRNHNPSVCPKTGKHPGRSRRYRWLWWLFPVAGLVSLVWFVIRVVPKPSRATYPCQRVAAPLASGFLVWIIGLIGSTLAYRKARRLVHQSRYFVAAVCAVVAVVMVWWSLSINAGTPARAGFTPSDPPNSPMGVAKGIYPGRVVWIHDPNSTSWNGSTGSWWSDTNTNQLVVNSMVSKTVQYLTGEVTNAKAWDALFRHFNQTHGFGDIGYQAGEKIVIKINMNQQDNWNAWGGGAGMPSPHVIYALLDQLVNVVGVPGSAITIYDAARYIGDPIYNKVRSNPNFQSITFVVKNTLAGNGRIAAAQDTANPLYTQGPPTAYLPTCVTQAKYLINMALLRPHQLYGVTLCGKNNFGSVYFPNNGGWTPSPLHNYGGRSKAMNTYNCLVELNGHRHLAGKTLLYMVDGLYPAVHQSGNVIKWQTFGNDWCSSIFASQDPVAIDSVGTDFLRTEPACNADVIGNPDNYLHEMAQADNPPSGTVYDPEHDGTRLASLGVHEHWNNPTDRQYSRNLETGNGIELVTRVWTTPDGPVENRTAGKRYDYIRYAINEARPGDEIVIGEGVYYESINFNGKNLTIRSTDPNNPAIVAATVISGGSKGSVVIFFGGEGVNCALAGFTITGGKSGIYCSSSSSPIIRSCVIEEDGSVAIELGRTIKPAIIDCTIIGEVWVREVENINTGEKYDYVQPAIDNATSGDQIVISKGIYYENINFKGKKLTLRSSVPCDSAIAADTIIKGGSNVVTFSSGEDANCVLAGLTIAGGNKGIYCSGSAPTITRCVVTENTAQGIYAYTSAPKLTNCIIATNEGAGVAVDSGSGLAVINCTIVGNRGSGITVNMCSPKVVNSIVWNNSPKQITGTRGSPVVTYSDVQGGWPNTGNINIDPCFADANNGDYHLQSAAGRWKPNPPGAGWVFYDANTSFCIDTGDPNSNWTAELWPNGRRINMGAYGGAPEASMSPNSIGNVADLNHDDAVDWLDFALFADSWQIERILLVEDFDRRGSVDFNDLRVLIENWLWEEE